MLSEKNLYILWFYETLTFLEFFSVFSIEEKTPEEKEILNISDSWLEMSFLSNFNILIGILLGPTDLLESNEDMIFSISD